MSLSPTSIVMKSNPSLETEVAIAVVIAEAEADGPVVVAAVDADGIVEAAADMAEAAEGTNLHSTASRSPLRCSA